MDEHHIYQSPEFYPNIIRELYNVAIQIRNRFSARILKVRTNGSLYSLFYSNPVYRKSILRINVILFSLISHVCIL